MKPQALIAAAVALAVLGWIMGRSPIESVAVAQDATTVTTAALGVVSTPTVGAKATYVGSNKCKMCHMKQARSWKKTAKYHAIDSLRPGNAVEAKTKHGLDTSVDYSKKAECVKCHVTGFDKPGGYALHDASDKKLDKKMKKLANVGCEMCHGPGSEYIALHKELLKSRRKYKAEEMYAAGMYKPDAALCITCHNDESPTIDKGAPFDFDSMKEKGTHEHFKLKQLEK